MSGVAEYRVSQRELMAGPAGGPWRLRLWLCWHILAGHVLETYQHPTSGFFIWRAHR